MSFNLRVCDFNFDYFPIWRNSDLNILVNDYLKKRITKEDLAKYVNKLKNDEKLLKMLAFMPETFDEIELLCILSKFYKISADGIETVWQKRFSNDLQTVKTSDYCLVKDKDGNEKWYSEAYKVKCQPEVKLKDKIYTTKDLKSLQNRGYIYVEQTDIPFGDEVDPKLAKESHTSQLPCSQEIRYKYDYSPFLMFDLFNSQFPINVGYAKYLHRKNPLAFKVIQSDLCANKKDLQWDYEMFSKQIKEIQKYLAENIKPTSPTTPKNPSNFCK